MALTVAVIGLTLSVVADEAIAQIRAALVKNVDEPGRAPYQQMVEFNQVSGFGAVCPTATVCVVGFGPVPPGKRLVVEHITMLIMGFQPTFVGFGDASAPIADIVNVENLAIVKPDFAPGPLGPSGPSWLMDRPVRVYFEAGATPKLKVRTSAFSSATSSASIHGYLIDAAN
jgi:hypothetical protein